MDQLLQKRPQLKDLSIEIGDVVDVPAALAVVQLIELPSRGAAGSASEASVYRHFSLNTIGLYRAAACDHGSIG